MPEGLVLADVAALLAVAQDFAFGQDAGAQLRATALGQQLAGAAGLDAAEMETTWLTSSLRYLGCTGHAYDTAILLGDEISLRADSLRLDMGNPLDVVRLVVDHAGSDLSGFARFRAIAGALAAGRKPTELNFRMACEVADGLAVRLGLNDEVRQSLATNFERWNGRGLPSGLKRTAIPRPMRIAQLSQEFEVLARLEGLESSIGTVRSRRDKAYDPELADLIIEHGAQWWADVEQRDPWDAALALAPPGPPLHPAGARDALFVLADFADLKSPWTSGHSRAVAALALEAGGSLAEAAALVHDLGSVAVPNTVCDKGGPFTRDERDRMEMHALVTDQLLRRVPALVELADVASGAHERLDGSGYHRRLPAAHLDQAQRVLAAADCYQAMTSDRPHRSARAPEKAAEELRSMVAEERLDGEAVERVLSAAGHRRAARPPLPAGLTAREIDVLRLVAVGLTTRAVADQLVISPKTADRHVQNIYAKIGVSTRGAATLFAIEKGILPAEV
jgi:HD-GYP domain-containing protein (c-di-GMP phosphodiesterase class II)